MNTELVVSVQAGEASPVTATMLNTSATGALIQCKQALGDLDDKLTISVELSISKIQKYLRFTAVIRNLTLPEEQPDNEAAVFRYGVQFIDLDDDHNLILNAYVHEQVVLQMEE